MGAVLNPCPKCGGQLELSDKPQGFLCLYGTYCRRCVTAFRVRSWLYRLFHTPYSKELVS
jgi:hypothetical protein